MMFEIIGANKGEIDSKLEESCHCLYLVKIKFFTNSSSGKQ